MIIPAVVPEVREAVEVEAVEVAEVAADGDPSTAKTAEAETSKSCGADGMGKLSVVTGAITANVMVMPINSVRTIRTLWPAH